MNKLTPKYKLTRTSDGLVPKWPHFVLGACDPASYAALQAYIVRGKQLGYSQEYLDEVDRIAENMEAHLKENGPSDVGQPTVAELASLCAEAERELLWCAGGGDFAPGDVSSANAAYVLAKLKAVRERFAPQAPEPKPQNLRKDLTCALP